MTRLVASGQGVVQVPASLLSSLGVQFVFILDPQTSHLTRIKCKQKVYKGMPFLSWIERKPERTPLASFILMAPTIRKGFGTQSRCFSRFPGRQLSKSRGIWVCLKIGKPNQRGYPQNQTPILFECCDPPIPTCQLSQRVPWYLRMAFGWQKGVVQYLEGTKGPAGFGLGVRFV